MTTIDITLKSVFKVAFVILLIYSISLLFNVIIIVFVSIICSSAIKPVITKAVHYKIPKSIATLGVVFGFLGLLVFMLYLGVQPIVREMVDFVGHLGSFLDTISTNYNIKIPNQADIVAIANRYAGNLAGTLGGQVGDAGNQIVRIGSGVLNIMLSTLALLALTFYQLAEEDKIKNFIAKLFGENEKKVKNIINRSENKLGSWFRGQLSLMVFIGVITYIGLSIVGYFDPTIAKFALPLAVIAGVLEIVPVLGPTLALVPAVFVGAATAPIYILVILVMYLLIQQVESNIVIPRVMNKAVGIDPMIVIIGIMVGNTLIGPLGSLLSVPVMAVLSVLYEEWQS
jgi:predicted PurR-regulated permease PerM